MRLWGWITLFIVAGPTVGLACLTLRFWRERAMLAAALTGFACLVWAAVLVGVGAGEAAAFLDRLRPR